MDIPPEVRALAEDSYAYVTEAPGVERIDADEYVITCGPAEWMNSVLRVRLPPEGVAAAVASVRETIAARSRSRVAWFLGPSTRPADLGDRLAVLGLVPADKPPLEPLGAAMALVSEPASPAGVEARRIESFDEFAASLEVQWAAFGMPPESRERDRAGLPELWRELAGSDVVVVYGAWIGGRLVAAARAAFTPAGAVMVGGATLPEARGRGAYQALVRARWDDAVLRGTPALVSQAGSLSRPILERLGFVVTGELRLLLDEGPWP